MHNLLSVDDDPGARLDAVYKAKQGERALVLAAAKPAVLARYKEFQECNTAAKIGGIKTATWTVAEREALENSYRGQTKPLRELKTLITDLQPSGKRKLCPYCGIGGTAQFDHYLPQALFPEFSVHPLNLTPSCGVCNNTKLATFVKPGKGRVILNMYLDKLPETSFLDVSVSWAASQAGLVPSVVFKLSRPKGYSLAHFDHLQRHVDHLKLLARFADQAHSEFVSLRDAALAEESTDREGLRTFLTRFVDRRTVSLGPLNWKLALFRKLIEHDPFLDDCLV